MRIDSRWPGRHIYTMQGGKSLSGSSYQLALLPIILACLVPFCYQHCQICFSQEEIQILCSFFRLHFPIDSSQSIKLAYSHSPMQDRLSQSSDSQTVARGPFRPAASYKMACQDLWSCIFYLHHISVQYSNPQQECRIAQPYSLIVIQFIVENCLLTYWY